MDDTSAGDWLRHELKRRGLSVHDVTVALGLKATATVYAWMTQKATPTTESAAGLAQLLGMPEIEVRRRFGLWTPAGEDEAEDDSPYTDPAEREIWKLTELPESERLLYIQLLRERRRAAG